MILAIDTSSAVASVALVSLEADTAGEVSALSEKSHSKVIMPMIEHLFEITGVAMDSIRFIACVQGPGSFTGLRIGASAAKGLAYALKKIIVPVTSLDALAYNIIPTDALICPIIDAKRGYVYTARYHYLGNEIHRDSECETMLVGQLADRIRLLEKPVIFTGNGVAPYRQELEQSGLDCTVLSNFEAQARACAAGRAAIPLWQAGVGEDSFTFSPHYIGRPDAEEYHGL